MRSLKPCVLTRPRHSGTAQKTARYSGGNGGTVGDAMTNEYGVTLDRNGYAPSIVQDIDGCWFCKTQQGKLDRHEIYHGAYRKKSKALGLWALL